jgi:Hydrolases of the alpha/beta superfamily
MTKLANDTRVFKINPEIDVQNVRFQNRYGFILAGHLYLPLNFDDMKQYPAIVISGPFGAVKEQSSGLYAQTLAEKGFVLSLLINQPLEKVLDQFAMLLP